MCLEEKATKPLRKLEGFVIQKEALFWHCTFCSETCIGVGHRKSLLIPGRAGLSTRTTAVLLIYGRSADRVIPTVRGALRHDKQ